MTFEEFKEYAIDDDAENCFSTETNVPSVVPIHLIEFYKRYNPIDVEISSEIGAVRFYPINKLDALQQEYGIDNAFVFATCNSDPIFFSEGLVYTYPHGTKNAAWELLELSITSCFITQQ